MKHARAATTLSRCLIDETLSRVWDEATARKFSRTILRFGFAVLTSVVVAMPATFAASLPFGSAVNGYAIAARNRDGRLVSLDFNAPGSLTTIGPATQGATIWGAGYLGGTLYALGDTGFYSIDTTTGALTQISATAGGGQVWGMTCDPVTQTLYWIGGSPGQTTLSTIDPASGATTPVATISGSAADSNITAIAADSQGRLYAIDQTNDRLITINKATGVTAVVGPLGVLTIFVAGLAFDPASGTLYFANGSLDDPGMYTINSSTGEATLVATVQNGDQLVALAIPPTCFTSNTIFCDGFDIGAAP